jgi:hypothetical protein
MADSALSRMKRTGPFTVRCVWRELPGSSMRDPAPDAPPTLRDLRRAAILLLGAAGGDLTRVERVVRDLLAPPEAL